MRYMCFKADTRLFDDEMYKRLTNFRMGLSIMLTYIGDCLQNTRIACLRWASGLVESLKRNKVVTYCSRGAINLMLIMALSGCLSSLPSDVDHSQSPQNLATAITATTAVSQQTSTIPAASAEPVWKDYQTTGRIVSERCPELELRIKFPVERVIVETAKGSVQAIRVSYQIIKNGEVIKNGFFDRAPEDATRPEIIQITKECSVHVKYAGYGKIIYITE